MKKNFTFAILTLALALTTTSAYSEIKIATVDMQKLFEEYYRTEDVQKELNEERAKLQKENNERLAGIQKLEGELRTARKKLEDPSLNDTRKQDLFKGLQEKSQEAVALNRERREYLERRQKALQEKNVQQMRGILDEIRQKVEEKAKAEDFDYVFDRSGSSLNQVPFLLYSKDATDITPSLLENLNADAPKTSE